MNQLNELSIHGQHLEQRYVLLRVEALKPEYHDLTWRVFHARGGFGCSPDAIGRAVFGTFVRDGEEARMNRGHVERFATDEEIAAAKAASERSEP
jgi:hypothetical protein